MGFPGEEGEEGRGDNIGSQGDGGGEQRAMGPASCCRGDEGKNTRLKVAACTRV